MKPVILLSKDILMPDYLPVYGNSYWKTPNIDAIAEKGTVFMKHYTAAPSTAMSFTAMCTAKYPYELDRKVYKHEDEYGGNTIFDEFKRRNVDSHIIWSDNYMKVAKPYANCFRNATIHTIDMNQPVGPYIPELPPIERSEEKAKLIINSVFELAKSLLHDDVFLWIHLPHVILGRCSYGDDIDLVDDLVGKLREIVSDDCFYITADHGNMNGAKGKWVYGFEVFEPAIHIPLITPRIEGLPNIDFITSNTQLMDLILNQSISKKEFIVSDSTYFEQPNRCLAIRNDRYKLIYEKLKKKFSLFDIEFDPAENVNLLEYKKYDKERHRYTNVKEVYYYPLWDEVDDAYESLLAEYKRIYRKGNWKTEFRSRGKYYIVNLMGKYISRRQIHKKKVRK